MDSVLRAVGVYLILLVLLRISGKRTLSQVTTFDFVLILIIAETTQQALLGEDYSLTNMTIIASTLVLLSLLLAYVDFYLPQVSKWVDGAPLIVVRDGEILKDRVRKELVTEEDILESARQKHGIERMDQIKYAVLEKSGDISIIPKE
jgi:uncharacterized membrane protein YcaP (DUF421 family)